MKAFVIILVFFMAGCGQRKTQEESVSAGALQNDMPPIPLLTADRKVLSGKDLPSGSILIFFQPDCDHCQREAQAISDRMSAFEGYRLFFISPATFEEMNSFATQYGLAGNENVQFVQTTTEAILQSVGAISAPSMFIYSTEKKLVKHLDGERHIDEILSYL